MPVMFFYMERCSRIVGEGTIRAVARANRLLQDMRDVGSGSMMPHFEPVTCPCLPAKIRRVNQEQSKGRNDEGFSDARGAAARRIARVVRG